MIKTFLISIHSFTHKEAVLSRFLPLSDQCISIKNALLSNQDAMSTEQSSRASWSNTVDVFLGGKECSHNSYMFYISFKIFHISYPTGMIWDMNSDFKNIENTGWPGKFGIAQMAGMAEMVVGGLKLGTQGGYTIVPPTPALPLQKKFIF